MNMTLYDLSTDYLAALDFFTDPEQDLPIEAVNDTLEGLEGQLQEKAVNVAKVLRSMEEMANSIKQAEQQMATRRKALENRVFWLKDYLKTNMEATGIQKIESPWFRLGIQNNPPSVEVSNDTLLPPEYVTVELIVPQENYEQVKDQIGTHQIKTVKVDKAGLKEALKAGKAIPGVVLSQGTRLVIR